MNRSIFLTKAQKHETVKKMSVNFGPQHPAAHGVLRMILSLHGEIIERSDPHIGLLHRGTEKLIESKPTLHALPYFDRLDYCSMMVQEHGYCLAVEKLAQKPQYQTTFAMVRTLYDELTRILNHLLALACHALDVGSMSPIFWGFEEREKIMEFYERVSGARMHAAFYRPSEINTSGLSAYLLEDIAQFANTSHTTINEINALLVYNKIWKQRLHGVGTLTPAQSEGLSLSGVLARSTGIVTDVRLSWAQTYAHYFYLDVTSFVGGAGDCYDRYLLRINEMVESLNITTQVLHKLLQGGVTPTAKALHAHFNLQNNSPYGSMEGLIRHFKRWSEGEAVAEGLVFSTVESPKGEFGVLLQATGSATPYRCRIKSPAYYSLQALPELARGHLLADLVTLIGTIDIVFGEIDR